MAKMKGFKLRTAEFMQSKEDLHKETLIDFVQNVFDQQEKITITAHRDEEGNIDCACLGDLCDVNYVPTEQMLGCKRLRWLFLEEDSEDERVRKEDHVEV